MKRMKCAILAGAAAMTIAAGTPVEAAQESDNRGTVEGWGSSGEDSPGYGSTSNPPRASKRSTGGKSTSSGSTTSGTTVPEPSNLLMLGLGLIGLIVGRMVARRRKKT